MDIINTTVTNNIMIRFEDIIDFKAVRELYGSMYDTNQNGNVIDMLRLDKKRYLMDMSIVFDINNTVIGHLMMFPIRIIANSYTKYASVLMLPIAVDFDYDVTSTTNELYSTGIKIAQQKDFTSIFVVGNPDYFNALGFESASNRNIKNTIIDDNDNKSLLVYEIKENGGLIGISG